MAEPLSADRLVKALRDEGVHVVEYKTWRTHNRNHIGAWGPVHGVMIHHTVTSDVTQSVNLCYDGRSDLPGPLCHGVISKKGTVYLVGNGRANHAGSGDGSVLSAVIDERDLPGDNEADTDGNAHFYGFECINLGDGEDPWPSAQIEAIVRSSAAICRAHGWGRGGNTSVIGHLEWQPGKIDPCGPGISMEDVRTRVAERLRHPADWSPEGESMPQRRIYDLSEPQTLTPGEWHTISFDRVHDGQWRPQNLTRTVLRGSAFYTISVGVRLAGLATGQEVQLRVGRNIQRDGVWQRASSKPISSSVHGSGDGHAVYTWSGRLNGDDDGRLVCDVRVPEGDEKVTVERALAEVLYWM